MVKDCETRAARDQQGLGVLTWNGEPYGPIFDSFNQAEQFITFVGNRTGLDPRHQCEWLLDELGAQFRGRMR